MRDRSTKFTFEPISVGAGSDSNGKVYFQTGGGFLNLIFTRRGRAFFESGGQTCFAEPGDLMLLRPKPAVVIRMGPAPPHYRWDTYWVNCIPRPHWSSWLNWPKLMPGVMRLRPDKEAGSNHVLPRLAAVCRPALAADRFRTDELLNRFESLLLACRAINPLDPQGQTDPRLARVLDFLSEHYADPITLGELAGIACLSPSYFERFFASQVGMLPFRYLESLRMKHATELLATTDRRVGEIALEVGLADPFYFSKCFRRLTGNSPRQFRRVMRDSDRARLGG